MRTSTFERRGLATGVALVASVVGILMATTVGRGQALDETERMLEELTNAHGPSGFEGPVRDILRRDWQELLQDLRTDGMGNLYGRLPGSSESPRVLLMAHMDEVGFLVRYIDDDGFVYFNNVGGYFDQSLLSQRMTIMTPGGPVAGYIGFKSGHIQPAAERGQMTQMRDMFIDIGASSRREAMETFGVRPGLPITYRTEFEKLGNTGRYLAKAWDDRVGLAVITEALRQLAQLPHPNTVEVAATVQEEIGLRGAAIVEASTHPDIVINLEIGIAGDFPLLTSPTLSQEALGSGPSIFVFDNSMIPNNRYVEWIMALADDNAVPFQFESVSGYGEDGAMLQRAARGIPSVNIGIPTRYGHSQSGVIDRRDFDNTVKLVVAMVQALSAERVEAIRTF